MTSSLESSDQGKSVRAICVPYSEPAAQAMELLAHRLHDVHQCPRSGVPLSKHYLEFSLTRENIKAIQDCYKPEFGRTLMVTCQTPDDWWEWDCDLVHVIPGQTWVGIESGERATFLSAEFDAMPRIFNLPWAESEDDTPEEGVSKCFILPYLIAHVPSLKEWLAIVEREACILPLSITSTIRDATLSVYEDAELRCSTLRGWSMVDSVWNWTDYALIIPRTNISLRHSFTLLGGSPWSPSTDASSFGLTSIIGLPVVNTGQAGGAAVCLSSECHLSLGNPHLCNRDTLFSRDLAKSLWKALSPTQREDYWFYPVLDLSSFVSGA